MRDELPVHTVSAADAAARKRPVEYAGVLLGSAAAALIFGAGVAHADGDGSPSPNKPSESSTGQQQSGANATGPKAPSTGAGSQNAGLSAAQGAKDGIKDGIKDKAKDAANAAKDAADAAKDKAKEDAKDTATDPPKNDAPKNKDVVPISGDKPTNVLDTSQKNDPKTAVGTQAPTVVSKVLDTTPKLTIVPSPAPSQLATPTALASKSPSSLPAPNATLLTTALTTAASPTPAPVTPTTAAPTTTLAAAPPVPDFAALARQFQGLNNDLMAVAASITYNTAIATAKAFGPTFLFGAPYNSALTVASFAANLSKQLTGTPLTATSTGPFAVNYGVFDTNALTNLNIVPAGANDPTIKVSAAHPLPVILINGTLESQGYNWSVGAPVLANAGYKVYTYNYGVQPGVPVNGLGDIRLSAQELSDEIDAVLKETGAKQVVLVGHSQGGGILPNYYINVMGGGSKVSQLIGISPSNHGTDLNFIAYGLSIPLLGPLIRNGLGSAFPALEQQSIGSSLNQQVYGNGDTRPGVLYTTIVSTYDGVVTPYAQQFLTGSNVTNILVQDQYPNIQAGHLGLFVNPVTWGYVLGALAANPAANVPAARPLAVAV